MTSADPSGCRSSSSARRASAGGQLEQPSEVKSSTMTGSRATTPWELCAWAPAPAFHPQVTTAAKITRTAAATNLMRTCSDCYLSLMPETKGKSSSLDQIQTDTV